jgi:hypothetical protein
VGGLSFFVFGRLGDVLLAGAGEARDCISPTTAPFASRLRAVSRFWREEEARPMGVSSFTCRAGSGG